MDQMTARRTEEEMATRQKALPQADRCRDCDGQGWRQSGCAVFHALYERCHYCSGSGRNARRHIEAHLAGLEWLRQGYPEQGDLLQKLGESAGGLMTAGGWQVVNELLEPYLDILLGHRKEGLDPGFLEGLGVAFEPITVAM